MPNRSPELGAKILEASKRSVENKLPIMEVAKELGVSRSAITHGRIILEFGTPDEIEAVRSGKMGVKPVTEIIRKRLSEDEKNRLRQRNGPWTAKRRENNASDAEVWAMFSPTIRQLASLPDVKDMLRVVRSNRVREDTLKDYLETASDWLKEFMDEWNKYQRGKPTENSSDPGDGSTIS